jgi:hypothetical protein
MAKGTGSIMEYQMHSKATRVYDPAAINTMGWAFNIAYESLSEEAKGQPNIRRHLALCIIRLFDEGKRAPQDLSNIALSIVDEDRRKHVTKERIAQFNGRPEYT